MHDVPPGGAMVPDGGEETLLEFYLQSGGGRLVECLLRANYPGISGSFDESSLLPATSIVVQLL